MVLRRSWLVRLLVAIVLVALAAVGLRLSEDEDNVEVVRGVLGEPISIHGGTVTVSDVRVATALLKFDKVDARTPGLFVVVRLQIAVIGTKPVGAFAARLLSGDRRYDGFGLLNTGRTEPGFEASLDVPFEVDPAGIDDLTLELYPFEVIAGFHRNVRVHLGITPDNAGEWRAAGRDQSITTADRTVRGI